MPTGQIAGEVDVTCNHRRRQSGVLLLATTTQVCAEGRRPEALVHLVVEPQAQVGSSAPNYLSPRLNGLLCGPRTDSIIG